MKGMPPYRPMGTIVALVILSILFYVTPVPAVSPGEVSWTAEATTALRAIAAMDPDEKVRGTDSLAIKFVSPAFWHYSTYKPDFDTSQKVIKAWRVGTYYLVNARTKHTDKTLVEMASRGLRQVVVLGAGFDTRAYRFAAQMPEVRFFEMDLPATIARKEEMARAVMEKLPASLVYVPIDFNTQSILERLKTAGYREDLLTLFIWEGVTYYITEAAVDGTLRFVAGHSAPGSAIVFDYVRAEVVRGDFSQYKDGRFTALRCALAGEPWVFGFEENQSRTFVEKCGLQIKSDMGPEDMAKHYLTRSDGELDGTPSSFYRLMHAVVPARHGENAAK